MSTTTTPAGAFQRTTSIYRNAISKDGPYPPAAGRYILIGSYGCPWASRCLAVRIMKGLQEVINIITLSPVFARTRPEVDDHKGWVFDEAEPDPIFGVKTLRDFYEKASEGLEPKAVRWTVPVLFDTETKRIVNNESSEIIRFVNSEFDDFVAPERRRPHVDLYPEKFRSEIDAMNDSIYESINNGVYKCGFARSQEAYNASIRPLFKRLDELDLLLSKQRYLIAGAGITESDIRLFVTLVRFDPIYFVHFKCSKKLIREYTNLSGWLRDVYQTAKLAPSVNLKQTVEGYYTNMPEINPFKIVSVYQDSNLDDPHNRASIPL
jgi:putative glutathione S-transferase